MDHCLRAEGKLQHHPFWLQAGPFVVARYGVFIDTQETDEITLDDMQEGVRDVNGVCSLENGVVFAPYSKFLDEAQGQGRFTEKDFARALRQRPNKFAETGLARALEHTTEKVAPCFQRIIDQFPRTHFNIGLTFMKHPSLTIVNLGFHDYPGGKRKLYVGERSQEFTTCGYFGFAFGKPIAA